MYIYVYMYNIYLYISTYIYAYMCVCAYMYSYIADIFVASMVVLTVFFLFRGAGQLLSTLKSLEQAPPDHLPILYCGDWSLSLTLSLSLSHTHTHKLHLSLSPSHIPRIPFRFLGFSEILTESAES